MIELAVSSNLIVKTAEGLYRTPLKATMPIEAMLIARDFVAYPTSSWNFQVM
jgi:hypothetical protein